jgi:hypothetical protein
VDRTDSDTGRLSFLHGKLPAGFELEVVRIEPGEVRPYHDADWWDALVVVERGEIELECDKGGRRKFVEGAVLWLVGLPLVALHNPGPEPVLLSAVSRSKSRPMNSDGSRGLNGKEQTRSPST